MCLSVPIKDHKVGRSLVRKQNLQSTWTTNESLVLHREEPRPARPTHALNLKSFTPAQGASGELCPLDKELSWKSASWKKFRLALDLNRFTSFTRTCSEVLSDFDYVRGVRSLGINSCVLCTDVLESLNVSCVMEAAQRIGAYDVYVVRFD